MSALMITRQMARNKLILSETKKIMPTPWRQK